MTTLCSHHALDSLGWPLGNCPGCVAYRKLMSEWYDECVRQGNHDPDRLPQGQLSEERDW